MKINIDSSALRLHRKIEQRRKWARWFAWHPVRIDGERVAWLDTVERKRPVTPLGGQYDGTRIEHDWEYRLPRHSRPTLPRPIPPPPPDNNKADHDPEAVADMVARLDQYTAADWLRLMDELDDGWHYGNDAADALYDGDIALICVSNTWPDASRHDYVRDAAWWSSPPRWVDAEDDTSVTDIYAWRKMPEPAPWRGDA